MFNVCCHKHVKIMNKKKEQFAVYEKEPAKGKDNNTVILAPYNTIKEAENAKKRYGYNNNNYYVDVLRW